MMKLKSRAAHNRLRASRLQPAPGLPGATVSVVIPCFNYARYLPFAIESVLTQEGVDVDVIVVDDASTDDSRAVAHRFAVTDARVRVIENSLNRGAVATFNRGLEAVTGEFVVRLDADDMLTPGSLQRAVALMQRVPSVGLVYGHPLHFTGQELPTPRMEVESWTLWKGDDWFAARCADGTNTITSPEAVMRRSVVDMVGGQRELAHTHDMEMWLRISTCSDIAHVNGADQAWHREHPGSLSTFAEEPLIILREIRDAFDLVFDQAPRPIASAGVLRRRARSAVARSAVEQALRLLDRDAALSDIMALRDLASAICPAVVRSPSWQRLQLGLRLSGWLPSGLTRMVGVLPRLLRRVRYHIRHSRWEATGVYERIWFCRDDGSTLQTRNRD
ncbi:glycosyltransferase family 2 protein [Microbacterium sp. NPDC055312]